MTTQTFRIAVIAGDGIGPEVTAEAIRATEAAAALSSAKFDWTHFPWGTDYYFEHGRMAPADYLDEGLDRGHRLSYHRPEPVHPERARLEPACLEPEYSEPVNPVV